MSKEYANKILENYHIPLWCLPMEEQGKLPRWTFLESH